MHSPKTKHMTVSRTAHHPILLSCTPNPRVASFFFSMFATTPHFRHGVRRRLAAEGNWIDHPDPIIAIADIVIK